MTLPFTPKVASNTVPISGTLKLDLAPFTLALLSHGFGLQLDKVTLKHLPTGVLVQVRGLTDAFWESASISCVDVANGPEDEHFGSMNEAKVKAFAYNIFGTRIQFTLDAETGAWLIHADIAPGIRGLAIYGMLLGGLEINGPLDPCVDDAIEQLRAPLY